MTQCGPMVDTGLAKLANEQYQGMSDMHVCMAKQLMSTRSWGKADESLNLPQLS